jgi:hypothetical protein
MKKITIVILLLALFLPIISRAETPIGKPTEAVITSYSNRAVLSWKNPGSPQFLETILFRSTIPIPDYFSYPAVSGLCDKIYEGREETYTDTGLAVNLPYYYILFALDRTGSSSLAVVMEKKIVAAGESNTSVTDIKNNTVNNLAGATSEVVNQISKSDAEIIYNYNGVPAINPDDNSQRLSLFIIARSPQDLTAKDKQSISYFIHAGTPTTIFLGAGERAGVLNSYLSVFDKLPKSILEWQDIIKIANGRWPDERSTASEERASNVDFSAIYERKPNMNNPKDSAAVTVIAYGLRPAARNMGSEAKALEIYRGIFGKRPSAATDWDLVRAIAYSGAVR